MGKKPVSAEAEAEYAADVALAARFDELLGRARAAEQGFRVGQARAVPVAELYPLAKALDARDAPADRNTARAARGNTADEHQPIARGLNRGRGPPIAAAAPVSGRPPGSFSQRHSAPSAGRVPATAIWQQTVS
jgi:hypothetical protein